MKWWSEVSACNDWRSRQGQKFFRGFRNLVDEIQHLSRIWSAIAPSKCNLPVAQNHATLLSFDEKSQIQALDRTQPGLRLKKSRCGTVTHDYKRHGATTFHFAPTTASWLKAVQGYFGKLTKRRLAGGVFRSEKT